MVGKLTAELVKEAMRHTPDKIIIGDAPRLSKRKARKLANRYRGSSRGDRYAEYLAKGHIAGYWVVNNRLIRLPKFGKRTITTIHSASAVEMLKAMANSGRAYSFEGGPELDVRLGPL